MESGSSLRTLERAESRKELGRKRIIWLDRTGEYVPLLGQYCAHHKLVDLLF
jgi:hypothetical protein